MILADRPNNVTTGLSSSAGVQYRYCIGSSIVSIHSTAAGTVMGPRKWGTLERRRVDIIYNNAILRFSILLLGKWKRAL